MAHYNDDDSLTRIEITYKNKLSNDVEFVRILVKESVDVIKNVFENGDHLNVKFFLFQDSEKLFILSLSTISA